MLWSFRPWYIRLKNVYANESVSESSVENRTSFLNKMWVVDHHGAYRSTENLKMFQKRGYYYFVIQKSHLNPCPKINASSKTTIFILISFGTSVEFIEPPLSIHIRYSHVFGRSIYAHAEPHTIIRVHYYNVYIYTFKWKKIQLFCDTTFVSFRGRFAQPVVLGNINWKFNLLFKIQNHQKKFVLNISKSNHSDNNFQNPNSKLSKKIIFWSKIKISAQTNIELLYKQLKYNNILHYFVYFSTYDRWLPFICSMTLYILIQKYFQNPKSKSSHEWFLNQNHDFWKSLDLKSIQWEN